MGSGKFFGESSAFLFGFWALFVVLIGVSGAAGWYFSVTFNVVKSDFQCCQA